ncbi:MAG: hypothetical protein IJW40_00285 [Clostridia bacterium]|nr:hypothetical protein [Clostridia bacterium]
MKNIDPKTLSYINLFAIFGAIPKLCELNSEARALIAGKKISLGITVKDGPSGVLRFEDGAASMTAGQGACDIRLSFSIPEKFNGMIDGTVTPIPSKGLLKVGFLLKTFIPLTDILSRYLRPQEEDMKNEDFFRTSTILMFHVITGAVAQIGNTDRIGRASASYIVDGNVRMLISEGEEIVAAAHIAAKDHVLTTRPYDTEDAMSVMQFDGIRNARGLFDGTASSFTLICDGKLSMRGMISQLDNVNRILDRVAIYLA